MPLMLDTGPHRQTIYAIPIGAKNPGYPAGKKNFNLYSYLMPRGSIGLFGRHFGDNPARK